jgi:hypothetical protein
VGWITLPRNLLEQQFDALRLERHFENGLTDTADRVERLSDYPDPEEDARCSESLQVVTADDLVLSHVAAGLVLRCHTCGKTVTATWNKRYLMWAKPTHHAPPIESEGPVQ